MTDIHEIEVTFNHLDDAIVAQGLNTDNTSCILAQLGTDLWGDNGGAGNTSVNSLNHGESMRFIDRRLAQQLSSLNDQRNWGAINQMLPLTLSYKVDKFNVMQCYS